jgi:hypothetical protein
MIVCVSFIAIWVNSKFSTTSFRRWFTTALPAKADKGVSNRTASLIPGDVKDNAEVSSVGKKSPIDADQRVRFEDDVGGTKKAPAGARNSPRK